MAPAGNARLRDGSPLIRRLAKLKTHSHISRRLFHNLPPRLCFPLKNIIREQDLQQGHIFLGFTKWDRFLLSYTRDIDDENAVCSFYIFRLHWWEFTFTSHLKKVYDVRLFGNVEIFSDLFLSVCEWPSDRSKILVYGLSLPMTDDLPRNIETASEDQRDVYVTVLSTPDYRPCHECRHIVHDSYGSTTEGHRAPKCHCNGFLLHFKYQVVYPFPSFQPSIQLRKDGVFLLNTSYSLLACAITYAKENAKHGLLCTRRTESSRFCTKQSADCTPRLEAEGLEERLPCAPNAKGGAVAVPKFFPELNTVHDSNTLRQSTLQSSPHSSMAMESSESLKSKTYNGDLLSEQYQRHLARKSPDPLYHQTSEILTRRPETMATQSAQACEEWVTGRRDATASDRCSVVREFASEVFRRAQPRGEASGSSRDEDLPSFLEVRRPGYQQFAESVRESLSMNDSQVKDSVLCSASIVSCGNGEVPTTQDGMCSEEQKESNGADSESQGGGHIAGTSPTAVCVSAEWDATEPSLVSYTRTLYGGSMAGNARASGFENKNIMPIVVTDLMNCELEPIGEPSTQDTHLCVEQLCLDFEFLISEIIRTEASWAHRFCSFTDYDVVIMEVCPEEDSVVISIGLLLLAYPVDIHQSCSNSPELYQTALHVAWDLHNGAVRVLGIGDLDRADESRIAALWRTWRQSCAALLAKSSVPTALSHAVNRLTNEAVYKGRSLRFLQNTAGNVGVLLI
uniref:DDB1- and CUL4-associated factor 15 isoform X2 n=1 Tax=Myxine glutinosa TaxID=7769 RepID=UPI00358F4A39